MVSSPTLLSICSTVAATIGAFPYDFDRGRLNDIDGAYDHLLPSKPKDYLCFPHQYRQGCPRAPCHLGNSQFHHKQKLVVMLEVYLTHALIEKVVQLIPAELVFEALNLGLFVNQQKLNTRNCGEIP